MFSSYSGFVLSSLHLCFRFRFFSFYQGTFALLSHPKQLELCLSYCSRLNSVLTYSIFVSCICVYMCVCVCVSVSE